MVSSTPAGLRGNSGLFFQIDGDDFDGNLKTVRITTEDKDDGDLTFLEASSGETKDYKLVVTAIQSTAAGSLWRMLWDNPGAEDLAVTYGPHGNAVPSASQPHFVFNMDATGRPEIGKEASLSKTRSDFEYTFDVTSTITLDDGA